jgi:hypothetical protein
MKVCAEVHQNIPTDYGGCFLSINLLTAWCEMLIEKLIVTQLVNNVLSLNAV